LDKDKGRKTDKGKFSHFSIFDTNLGLPFRMVEKAIEYSLKLDKFPELGKPQEEYYEELYDLIDENLKPSSTIPIIDLKYFAKYNKKAGFKVAIDGFHNLKKKGKFITLYCLNPPGVMYKEGELTIDEAWRVIIPPIF
jgi:hypothetical protein